MHPELLRLGPLPIRTYSVLVAFALVGGLVLAVRHGRRVGLPVNGVLDVGAASIVGGLLGARLLFVLVNFQDFWAHPQAIFRIQEGGSVFFGGVLGGALLGMLVARVRQVPIWKMLDAASFSLASGMVLGRFGCWAQGCCYGRPGGGPFAVEFLGGMRHPTQLYQVIEGLLVFTFVAFAAPRMRRPGTLWLVFVLFAGVTRIAMELFRGDALRGFFAGLSTSTWLGVLLASAAGATLLVRSLKSGS